MNQPAKCQQMSSGVPEFMAKKRSRGHPSPRYKYNENFTIFTVQIQSLSDEIFGI